MENCNIRLKQIHANQAKASRTYYEANKQAIAFRRKAKREQIKNVMANITPQTQQQPQFTPEPEPELATPTPEPRRGRSKNKPAPTPEPMPEPIPAPITKPTGSTKVIKHFVNSTTGVKTRGINLSWAHVILDKAINKKTEKDLADATREKYKKNIKQLFRILDVEFLNTILNTPQKIVDAIEAGKTLKNEPLSIASKADILLSLLVLLNHEAYPTYKKNLYDILDTQYNEFNNRSMDSRKAKKDDENFAVERIEPLIHEIKNKFGENSKESIILNLYKECVKRDDFNLVIVKSKEEATDKEQNYLILRENQPAKLYIQRHKTDKLYKAELEPLSIGLTNQIKEYMKNNKISYGDKLFKEFKLGPFVKRMFSKIGKNVSITTLRHIVISNVLHNEDTTIEEADALAKTSKHSRAGQKLYLRKLKE